MSEVVIENLTKKFGNTVVLERIDLKIDAKEFFVLLGPSGSGKTTLLRLIAGLEEITEGSIYIGGRKVNDLLPKERNVAMVFQNYALYPHFNIYDNIALPLKVRHLSAGAVNEKVKEVAKTLHIEGLLDKKPRQISGGQQQRVALARALVRDPSVFLLDEPLSNLDAKLRVEARAFLKRLQRELGITTIFVTHDQAEASTMATKIAVLNKGNITQVDDPYELYRRPNDVFTAGFVGSPAMNLIRGIVRRAGVAAAEGGGGEAGWEFSNEDMKITLNGIKAASDGQEVFLGIRPEHVRLVEHGGGAIDGTISIVEPMGSVTYLTVSVGSTLLTLQYPGELKLKAGSPVNLQLDQEDLLFYAADSGKRLANTV
ncbi:MAG: ABC transporter ATP-binding protein [Nitrososphaerota archaeon]|nr:ABC transporter ATP-binding protein [Nitrososphaerota archaeon]MDG7051508.1 ABC transporter ATP-binding protein [Nitrososphaerota archaeon]